MATESELLQAARTVFARHGYKAASMLEISQEAGMAVGGVYTFYRSKLALFQAVYFLENADSKRKIAAMVDWSQPKEALSAYVQANVAAIRDNKILVEWYSKSPGDALRKQYMDQHGSGCVLGEFFTKKIAAWRESGELRPEITDHMIEELFLLFTIVDASSDISQDTMQLCIDATLEKLFDV